MGPDSGVALAGSRPPHARRSTAGSRPPHHAEPIKLTPTTGGIPCTPSSSHSPSNGLDDAAFRAAAEEAAPAFARTFPGLAPQALAGRARVRHPYGGVYLFETAEAADGYLASDLFTAAVIANPRCADAAIRRAEVLAGPTAHTATTLCAAVA